MITSTAVKRYCDAVYSMHPVYVWGADMQVITKALMDKLIQKFGASHYKDIDLSIHEGLYGSDCSGMLTPISGFDSTARGYYNMCKVKGNIEDMPKDKTCLLFRQEGGNIVHVAMYTGDGLLYEMYNGCEKRTFIDYQWTYYGIPDWIEQKETITITTPTQVYKSAADAIAHKNPVAIYPAGEYYIYKTYKTATNITKKKGTAGGWAVLG